MPVIDYATQPEFQMRPGVTGRWLAGGEQGSSTVSVLWNEVEPGMGVPLHYHGWEELVLVQDGRIWVRIDDEKSYVSVGQTAIFPPNKVHAWGNDGPEVARVLFIWPVLDPFAPGKSTYLEGSPPNVG
jgi:quercetin dioxygenase-like cupin family protein